MKNGIYSVTELNSYIKNILDKDFSLRLVKLEGELSDVKVYTSGHMYFNIVDKDSSLSCVMFSSNRSNLNFKPKDGDKVFLVGSVNVYIKAGRYQFYCNEMYLSGEGDKLLKLQQLKAKLEKEGLFDPKFKKPINLFPNNIGIITAKNSAACADLVTNINRRYPICNVYVFYSLVQGEGAASSLVRALTKAYTYNLDTIIIARGGGSNEDLSAFNDETLVRLAFKSKAPIIAAVGHETDFTLLDFVASKRASTPTGAAELATIDKREVYELLDNYAYTISNSLLNRISIYKEKLDGIKHRSFFMDSRNIYKNKLNEIKNKKDSLNSVMRLFLERKISDLRDEKSKLLAINPKRVLSRGFALLKAKNGKIIKKVEDVKVGEEIVTTISTGNIYANVTRKEKHV